VTVFLDSILPTQGVYCVVGIKSKIASPSFYTTTAEVDQAASSLDTAGADAYFALASFKDNSSRKAENAAFMRSFFLDLDCGPGKPYHAQTDAAVALSQFIKDTGLPAPTIVNSGGGLHVYWPLTEDVPVAVWSSHARMLKLLCKEHKLHADPAVTADISRILRVPGTNNYKQDIPRPVAVAVLSHPVPLEEIVSRLGTPVADLSAAKMFGMDDTSKDVSGGAYPACSFARIVRKSMKGTGCNQIKNALENAPTLEEPMWRAALSIAVRCEDGNEAIHKLSMGHPGYNAQDTEQKALETKGPYTCQWYRENNSALCEGCTQKVVSPILIGKKIEAAPAEGDAYIIETPLDGDDSDKVGDTVKIEVPAYPYPYFRGAQGGVYKKEKTDDGETKEIEIYRSDLYITTRFFDSDEHGDGDGEMVLIHLHMSRDGVRRFYAPVTSLFAKDKLRDLLIKHGVIAYGKTLDLIMAYFASSIRKLQSQFAANKTRSQMGWTPDMQGFVVGELEYTAGGTKLAPPASGTRQLAPAFSPRGSLEEWKSIANFYNRPGMEPHALTLFFGFGAPLLKLMDNINVRGALINLKSNTSGSGKTTAQLLVNSIFGHPTELLMTKDDTYAAKMHRIGMLNSIAFTVDEITNTVDEELSDTAYGVTTGRARHRMESQSNKLRVNNTTWCNVTISSANASLVDRLAQLKSTADGELRRVFEYEVSKINGIPKTEIDAVFSKLNTNYGVAGPIYIQHVLANYDSVLRMLKKMQEKIDAELGFDQADRFYSNILTIAFVGALIAKKCELHDIDIPRVYKYAIGLVEQNQLQYAASLGSPLLIAQETLTAFVNENVNNVLVIDQQVKGSMPPAAIKQPYGPLRMRYEPNTKELYITAAEFRKFFTMRQVDVRESLKHLAQAGIAKHNGLSEVKRIGAGAVGSLSGLGARCYVFDGTAIGIDEGSFKVEGLEEIATDPTVT
jgi:uncharacterized protein (DUF927 family)